MTKSKETATAVTNARSAISDREGRVVREGDFVQYHGSITALIGQIMLIKGVGNGRLWLETATGGRLSGVRPSSVTFSALLSSVSD